MIMNFILQLGVKTRLQDFIILFNMKNGKCWLSVMSLIMVICFIMKYISITLKYHIITCTCSWYQVEQAHCTSVLHIFWRQVNTHLVSVCHPIVLHASMEIGKRLARFVSECMS